MDSSMKAVNKRDEIPTPEKNTHIFSNHTTNHEWGTVSSQRPGPDPPTRFSWPHSRASFAEYSEDSIDIPSSFSLSL
jgi:hypothetical protein